MKEAICRATAVANLPADVSDFAAAPRHPLGKDGISARGPQASSQRRRALERLGFSVGSWSAFPRSCEIRREGEVIHVEPKVMDVLVALCARSGEVVLRSELLDDIWGDAPLASDESLTRAISLLRKALGDSPGAPKFIETVPKRGYRALQAAAPIGAGACRDSVAPPLTWAQRGASARRRWSR